MPFSKEQCLANARECDQQAKTIHDQELRDLLKDIARQWRDLAVTVDKRRLH